MTDSTAQQRTYSDTEPFPFGYNSTNLEQFVATLEGWRDVRTLDVGPVCQENITFFAQRMGRHDACDMFLRLQRELDQKRNPANIFKHLDYPPRSFDGIQLWDLIDHLDDGQVKQLLERCFDMLRSTGLLMLIAFEKKPVPSTINAFVTDRQCRVDLRMQPHLDLPWYCRHNRALMSLLADFNVVKLFRYRNGLREVLIQKPGLVRD